MPSLSEILLALNLWWVSGSFETGIRRDCYFTRLRSYLESREIVVLAGVRREGEVDFIWKRPDRGLVAINVTATDEIPARETTSLLGFAGEFGDAVRDLILLTPDVEGADGPVRIVPVWRWLLDADRTPA